MSTIPLSYPKGIRVQRASAIGRTMLLSSLLLVAITILIVVVSASSTDFTHQVVVSQNSLAVVPVPTPAITEIQPVPSETLAISPDGTSEPSIVPVPVPTPPSQ